MFRTKPFVVLLLVIFVVIAGFLSFASRLGKPANTPSSAIPAPESQNAGTPTATTEAGKPSQGKPSTSPISPTQSAPTIKVVSPAAGERWVIGETNRIQWDRESGVTGSIYLVKASDNSVVGWINSETGPHQTWTDWDTRNISVSRYSSQKRSVEKGSYIVKIVFDTNQVPTASSNSFSVVYKTEIPIETYTVTIKGLAFSQSSLTVRQKDKITFVNNDSITHRVILSSFSPFVIEPGASYTFDTSPLFPGPYDFYSETYSSLKLRVTVR